MKFMSLALLISSVSVFSLFAPNDKTKDEQRLLAIYQQYQQFHSLPHGHKRSIQNAMSPEDAKKFEQKVNNEECLLQPNQKYLKKIVEVQIASGKIKLEATDSKQ